MRATALEALLVIAIVLIIAAAFVGSKGGDSFGVRAIRVFTEDSHRRVDCVIVNGIGVSCDWEHSDAAVSK